MHKSLLNLRVYLKILHVRATSRGLGGSGCFARVFHRHVAVPVNFDPRICGSPKFVVFFVLPTHHLILFWEGTYLPISRHLDKRWDLPVDAFHERGIRPAIMGNYFWALRTEIFG